jgi:hypothetical protein
MKTARPFAFLPLGLAAAGLAACSLLGSNEVKVTPVEHMSTSAAGQYDHFYESAVTAINGRDYARALDYLQEIRARDPRNVKALNALGVVYDKLGRFDLSARYYAQAQAIEPGSPIVARNMDYSKNLQGLMAPSQVAAAAPVPSNTSTAAAEKPAVLPPAGLPMMTRESGSATPVEVSLPVVKQPESKPVLAMADAAPVGKPVHLDIVLPESSPKHITVTKDVAVSKAAPLDMPVAGKSLLENKPVAAQTAVRMASALPLAKPISTEPASSVQPPASKRVPETNIAAVNETAPVAGPIPRPAPQAPAASKPVLETRTVAVNETVPVINPNSTPAPREQAASKPLPETKFAVADGVTPKSKPPLEPSSREAAMLLSIMNPLPVSAVLPVNKPVKTQIAVAKSTAAKKNTVITETQPVQRTAPVAKPEPAKLATLVQKPVPAAAVTNTASLRDNRPATAIKIAKPVRKVLTIGQPLRIFNATGKAIERVPHRLTSLGWTVRAAEGRRQQTSALYYPVKDLAAAKALQATLPFPVRMIENPGAGVRLVVGRDYLSWKPRNARLTVLWKNDVTVASLQRPRSTKGVH